MLTLLNRFSKYSIVIFVFLAITLSHAQDERAEDISILDVDASGEVDALTDGLLLLRSMFELTDDALVTGVVDSANCKECDAEGIDQYISTVKESTYGKLSANDDQNISGSSLDGKTLTIGIENGTSETVDLSGLTNELEIFQVIAQSAITANTAKTGITSDQANAITANTAKVGISDDQVEAINQISVNTEILSSYDSAITANTAKVGMTLGTTSSTALAGDTTTITASQASAITANTAKTGITSAQANAITANTAKTVLALGTSSTTALAGNTPLLALGTTSTTALAGNTPTIPSGLSDDVLAIKSALKCISVMTIGYADSTFDELIECIREEGLGK